MNQDSNQNHAYIQAYRAWVESLPAAEREALAASGLDQPDACYRTAAWNHDSAFDRSRAENFSGESADSQRTEVGDVSVGQSSEVADALAAFCSRIRSHPNPLLALDTLCFATGLMGVEGRSQTELAKRHKVTRAAFSKLVVEWIDLFDLTPPRGCRSLRARRAYSLSRKASWALQREAASC
jgi:hypothetical protein